MPNYVHVRPIACAFRRRQAIGMAQITMITAPVVSACNSMLALSQLQAMAASSSSGFLDREILSFSTRLAFALSLMLSLTDNL
jgi:hypothetical protein